MERRVRYVWRARGICRPLFVCVLVIVFAVPATLFAQADTPDQQLQIPLSKLPQFADAQVLPPAEESEQNVEKRAKKLADKYEISRIGSRGIGGGLNFYSLEKEQNLGRALAEEVERSAQLIGDPVVTEYVNRLGQLIVRNSDARVPFTIKVLDNGEVNAFALPGGFFYVNSGLILAAETEAELAAVMAHEVAHVAARHATRNATRAQIWNLASIPLIFAGGAAAYAVRQVAGLAVPMSFLKFSRNAEREADLLGLQYEYAAGYDPAAFVEFFERLGAEKKKKGNFIARAFMSHPMNGDRIKRAQEQIALYLPGREEYVVTTSEFEEVKARLRAVMNRYQIDEGKGPRPTLRRRDRPADAPSEQSQTQ
ncbi:MAG TPA: M48 family metalloprotease [Terriglobales bacterium]|nr:M48 family metalloprotease [Terriglobales bacterium]